MKEKSEGAEPARGQARVAVAINSSWNVINFRLGLVKALQRDGYDVVALTPEDRHTEQLTANGVGHVPIAMDKKGLSPVRDAFLLARYYRVLREVRPDVLLAFTAKPNVYASLAAHALGIPVVNNVAGLGTAFVTERWLTKLLRRLYRLAFRRSKTVFFQNRDDMDMFVRGRIARADQAVLLPGSGVDLDRFRPAAPSAPRDDFRFILIARLLWEKGIGEYVEAARRVRAAAPNARFQILGFVDVDNAAAVTPRDLDRWQSEGLVEYLGAADDVRPHIAAADCVVLPTFYREGMPRVLLEASAMGKPLITTDVAGCRDVIEDGRNGFLCAPRSAEALAEALLKILRLGPANLKAFSQAARRKAELEFDESIIIARYREAIRSALATR